MEKKFELVVYDIDGTLVNEQRILSPKTKACLNRLHQKKSLLG
ncbi:MAG: HAD hydrolase family protein [Erysipelotrichaceae bacterium]|nr:HAD hydrolase family protein [Erysipelotrichaceae bacterium]MDY5252667.1 HAD hydrolase family protein [Erysipelotrichaceae bacterium]